MKNNKSAIYGFVTLGVLTVVMLGVRVFQIVWDIDRITGNLRSSAVDGIIVPITLALVIITGVVFYIMSPNKNPDRSVIHSTPLGFCAIFFAAVGVVDGIVGYTETKEKLNELIAKMTDESSLALLSSAEFVSNVAFVALIFSLVTAIYFIWLACTYLNRKANKYPPVFLGLCIPLWFGLKLARDYIELTNLPVLTETIYDTLTLSALAIFMMAHVRFIADVRRSNTVRSNFAFGFLSILLAIVFPIPRYFMAQVLEYSINSSSGLFNLVNLVAAVYIAVFLIELEKKADVKAPVNPIPTSQQPPVFNNKRSTELFNK